MYLLEILAMNLKWDKALQIDDQSDWMEMGFSHPVGYIGTQANLSAMMYQFHDTFS